MGHHIEPITASECDYISEVATRLGRRGRIKVRHDNTGKRRSRYRATLPNGVEVVVNSYNVNTPFAYLGVFKIGDKWHRSGIFPTDTPPIQNQIFIIAKRVS